MIFSMISFLRKVINKTCSVLEMIQLLVKKKVFSLLGQIWYKLTFFTQKKKKGRNVTVMSLKTCGAI